MLCTYNARSEKMMKRIGSVMLVAILLLSAMVMFATPAMAGGLLELGEPTDNDPVMFTGTIIIEDGPWANKDIMIAKWNGSSGNWEYYHPPSEATTDRDGNYETGWAGFTPDGHFGMFVKECSDYWMLEHLIDEKDLTAADFTEQGAGEWLYDGGWNYEIPEFATIAIPAVVLLGLFALSRRKQKK